MKKLLPLLLLILIGCSEPEPIDTLNFRNDTYYPINSDEPYSGLVFDLYENGQIEMEGTLKDGKLNGPFKVYYYNEQLQEQGTFTNGTPDELWKYYKETTYKDGIEDGVSKLYDFNEQLINGPYKFNNDNGKLQSEGTFKDGKQDGFWKSYHDYRNGPLDSEGTYKDGIKVGLWKYYHDYFSYDGRVREEKTYNNGKPDGPSKSYYDNGQIKEEKTYNNGTPDGPWKSYYEDGQLKQDGTYKDGNKIDFMYNENGQLSGGIYIGLNEDGSDILRMYDENLQLEHENIGFKDGSTSMKYYHDNGQLRSEETYKDGELIDSKRY